MSRQFIFKPEARVPVIAAWMSHHTPSARMLKVVVALGIDESMKSDGLRAAFGFRPGVNISDDNQIVEFMLRWSDDVIDNGEVKP